MKKILLISLSIFSLSVLTTLSALAQEEALSKEEQKRLKEEQKRWKKKLKSMGVEKFYEVMTQYEQLKGQSGSFEGELNALQGDVDSKEKGIQTLDKSIEGLETRIAKLEENCNANEGKSSTAKGLMHKVQVGDFNDPTLKAFQEEGDFWEKDQILDGESFRKVYTIGYFTDNFQAQAFKKMLRDMGVKDAYVQTYQDGKKSTN